MVKRRIGYEFELSDEETAETSKRMKKMTLADYPEEEEEGKHAGEKEK